MKREEADELLHQKVEEGELISPVLPEGVKNYLIEILMEQSLKMSQMRSQSEW